MSMRGWLFRGQGEGSKFQAPKTSGGGRTPVRLTIPPVIVIFLVYISMDDVKCRVTGFRKTVTLQIFHTRK